MATPTTPSPIKNQPHQGTPPPDSLAVVDVGLTATGGTRWTSLVTAHSIVSRHRLPRLTISSW